MDKVTIKWWVDRATALEKQRDEAITQRDHLYRIAEMYYLNSKGADQAFLNYNEMYRGQ